MSDTIDLSTSPYFDDYDNSAEYYKILYKPEVPVQARELNQVQSIFQNQIENFSNVNYNDGDIVSGINIGYNDNNSAVLLQPLVNGVYTDTLLHTLVGLEVTGNITNVKAVITDYYIPSQYSAKQQPTIYVKYISTGTSKNNVYYTKFVENENLIYEDVSVAITSNKNASDYIGTTIYIGDGVIYYKGYFLNVKAQKNIVEQYSTIGNYRIGLTINESIITANTDPSLYDNSYNYTNHTAVGADRLKIACKLTILTGLEGLVPSNFVQLLRLKNGKIQYKLDVSVQNQIVDAIAHRTYETHGNYTVNEFTITPVNTLNNLFNDGLYDVNSITDDGITILNTNPLPNQTNSINGDDYVSLNLSKGTAIVKGYEYIYDKSRIANVKKTNPVKKNQFQSLELNSGVYLEINNVSGKLDLTNSFKRILLYDKPSANSTRTVIGSAYALQITNTNNINRLYITDLNTYTKLVCTNANANLLVGDYVYNDNFSGYVQSYNFATGTLLVEHSTGSINQLNELHNSRNSTILICSDVQDLLADNIKSVSYGAAFNADIVLDDYIVSGKYFTITPNLITPGSAVITSDNAAFTKDIVVGSAVKINNILAYVTEINQNGLVVSGNYSNQATTVMYKTVARINFQNKNAYTEFPEKYISATDNKTIDVVKQYVVSFNNDTETNIPYQLGSENPYGNALVQTSSGVYTASFISPIRIKLDNTTVNITDPTALVTVLINKSTPTNNTKNLISNDIILINKSKSNILDDKYGTRFQDREISLGFIDVTNITCVRYSNNSNTSPNYINSCFDSILVTSVVNISVGDIIYNATTKAKVVIISGNLVYVVYITKNHFTNNQICKNWSNDSIININTATSGEYIDVTSNYKLINGQSAQTYDISKLSIINANNTPTNNLVIMLDRYDNKLDADFTTVDSYVNISYQDIKNRNILDYRIFSNTAPISGTGTIINPYIIHSANINPAERILLYKNLPTPNGRFLYDYEYYIGRIDSAVIDQFGAYKIISGVPTITPIAPTITNGDLLIANIYIPAYVDALADIIINPEKTVRHTMADISKLSDRIANVESYVALNQLEQTTNNTTLVDGSGLVRTKTGFATDNFENFTLSDINNSQYAASINVTAKTLQPKTSSTNIDLVFNSNSTNYRKTGNILSLQYAEITSVHQNKSNDTLNVNPFNITNWEGVLTTYPNSDNWIASNYSNTDTIDSILWGEWEIFSTNYTKIPSNINILEQQLSTLYKKYIQQQFIPVTANGLKPNTEIFAKINNVDMTSYVIPALCTIIKGGANDTNNVPFLVGEDLIWYNPKKRTQFGSKYQPIIKSTVSCGKVKDLNTYLGTNNPYHNNKLLPKLYTGNTEFIYIEWSNYTGAFDYIDFIESPYIIGAVSGAIGKISFDKLITNEYGHWAGVIMIPDPSISTNPKFDTKNTYIKLYNEDTFVETNFQFYDSTNINKTDIISINNNTLDSSNINTSQISNNNITNNPSWYSPVAQTFVVRNVGGCHLTSVDLYFSDKDTILPIIVQVRTVEHGMPTELVVPFSEVVVYPNQIQISETGQISTKISFESLVYLAESSQYALVILTNSNKYKLYTANIGKLDTNTNAKIEEFPDTGMLFEPQNVRGWIGTKTKNLKCLINNAKFNINDNANIKVNNISTNNSHVKDALSLTNNSNVISLHLENHGFHTNNNSITISNVLSENAPSILQIGLNDVQVINNNSTILVEDATVFHQIINNQPVSITNPGYIKIDDEIISYIAVNTTTKLLTIPVGGRGKNSTPIKIHNISAVVSPYVLCGIPLTEINKTFVNVVPKTLDDIELITISSSSRNYIGGGSAIQASRNIQYELITSNISIMKYTNTNIVGTINTISNNSINNTSEIAYLPKSTNLDPLGSTKFESPMLVATTENEIVHNFGNKSITYDITLSSTNENISPLIDLSKCSVIATTNRIDNAITDDSKNTNISNFVYVTKPIKLIQTSTSVNVIFDGFRLASHQIDVYVKIARVDSLQDFEKQDYIKMPNIKYPVSDKFNTYNEFSYELRNLPQFSQFQIKIVGKSTSQASYPMLKRLRTISTIS